jgi:hypothetical protein
MADPHSLQDTFAISLLSPAFMLCPSTTTVYEDASVHARLMLLASAPSYCSLFPAVVHEGVSAAVIPENLLSKFAAHVAEVATVVQTRNNGKVDSRIILTTIQQNDISRFHK